MRNTNKKLRDEGKCIYTPPLGYLSEGSSSKPLDPERAPLVKRIFELYATGEWSFSTLAQWANNNGLTTRPGRRKRTKIEKLQGVDLADLPKLSRPITEASIFNMLNNPFYIGKLIHKGELLDSKVHQPLIDLATYYKVQAALKRKAVTIHYPNLEFYTYRGLVKCGTCRHTYSPYTQKGITYYRSQCDKTCPNSLKNFNERFITKKVQEILDRVHFTDLEINDIETNAYKSLDAITVRRNKQADDIRLQKNKALENLDYLKKDKLTLLRTGAFTAAEIIQEEGRLQTLLAEYEEKIASFSMSTKAMLEYVISYSELIKHIAFYFGEGLDTEKRDIVIQAFSELFIENGELKYVATEAYQALLERFDASKTQSCSEDYVILEVERIYHLALKATPMLNKILNKSPFLKAA